MCSPGAAFSGHPFLPADVIEEHNKCVHDNIKKQGNNLQGRLKGHKYAKMRPIHVNNQWSMPGQRPEGQNSTQRGLKFEWAEDPH